MINFKDILPKKVYIGGHEIQRYGITFPSGKSIILTKNAEYITSDQEEIDFLRKQKGLIIEDPSLNKESFMRYIGSVYSEQPTLESICKKSEQDVSKYLISTLDETEVISHLIETNYQGKLSEFLEKYEALFNEPKNETDISANSEEFTGEDKENNSEEPAATVGKNRRSK